ncbi:MAG: hypothetical protein IPH31_18155 [Lewinellaceae bacterium]|nr:hypothetical protein [Lewinellaceae bacterium]
MEGEQWGGGRGIFSYHLVEGLFGLADRNGDGTVSVGEIDRYLEDKVTAEAAPQTQVPMLLGNKSERLATVNAAILADLKVESPRAARFAVTEGGVWKKRFWQNSIRASSKVLGVQKAVAEKRFWSLPTIALRHFTLRFPGSRGWPPCTAI